MKARHSPQTTSPHTAGTAAREIGVSRERVHQLVAAGQLPARRDRAGRLLIEHADVERLIRARAERAAEASR